MSFKDIVDGDKGLKAIIDSDEFDNTVNDKSKNELKCKFVQMKNVILMQVINQPKDIRRTTFKFDNGPLKICSVDTPELTEDTIFIRGACREADEYFAAIQLDSIQEATSYLRKCLDTINTYNRGDNCDSLFSNNVGSITVGGE